MVHTSQKNSLPRRPQNHEIHETSSELLISETDFLGMNEDSCRETLRNYIEKSIVRDLTCSYTSLPRDSLLTMKTSKSLHLCLNWVAVLDSICTICECVWFNQSFRSELGCEKNIDEDNTSLLLQSVTYNRSKRCHNHRSQLISIQLDRDEPLWEEANRCS